MFNKRIEEKKKKKKKELYDLTVGCDINHPLRQPNTVNAKCNAKISRERKKKKIKKIIKSMDPSYFSKETVSLVKPPTSRA